jgi:heme-degrading monooxygenase HmoA
MFVVMNRIPIHPDHADAFIERFQDRAALVDNMPGFVSFRLLRPTQEGEPFVVETYWESKEHFENWTQSDEFKQGHAQAGRLPKEAFQGHPKLELFEVVQAAEKGEIL